MPNHGVQDVRIGNWRAKLAPFAQFSSLSELPAATRLLIVVKETNSTLQGRFTVPRPPRSKPEVLGILGVGLDSKDEHKRITRSDEMLLVGGSQETHEKMQVVAIRF